MDIAKLTPAEQAVNIRAALASPQGKVLKEFLRFHCYMEPAQRREPNAEKANIEFRYGRMTLFQLLEFYENPGNFKPATGGMIDTGDDGKPYLEA